MLIHARMNKILLVLLHLYLLGKGISKLITTGILFPPVLKTWDIPPVISGMKTHLGLLSKYLV